VVIGDTAFLDAEGADTVMINSDVGAGSQGGDRCPR
jgi:hypothetical protein